MRYKNSRCVYPIRLVIRFTISLGAIETQYCERCECIVDRSSRNDTYLYSLIANSSTSNITNIFSYVRNIYSSNFVKYDFNMFALPLHGTTHRLHQLNKVFLRNKAHIVFIYLLIYRMPQFTLRIVFHHKLHQYTNLDIQRKTTYLYVFSGKFAFVNILLSNLSKFTYSSSLDL